MATSGKDNDVNNDHVNETMNLLHEFQTKKNHFEYNINRLKSFQSSVDKYDKNKSSVNFPRRSPRTATADNLSTPTASSNVEDNPPRSPLPSSKMNQLLTEQMQYLFDVSENLIETVKNLQTYMNSLKSDYIEVKENYILIKNENEDLRKQISDIKKSDSNKVTFDASEDVTLAQSSPSLNHRIANLEQLAHNNDVILQGQKIHDIINNTSSNNSNLHDNTAISLTTLMPQNLTTNDLNNIKTTRIIGSTKKTLRLEISDKDTKIKLIRSIKSKRIDGLYASEYLVPYRRKLFHSARHLQKNHREKVKNVYTRDGIVYINEYSLDRSTPITTEQTLNTIRSRLESPTAN